MRIEGAQRRSTADKHMLDVGSRPAVPQVIDDSLPDFLTQRQSCFMAALSTHVNKGFLPVDITEPEMGDVARAEAQTGEQQ
jgi:hypothetical protein